MYSSFGRSLSAPVIPSNHFWEFYFTRHLFIGKLLNRVGCMVVWVTRVCGCMGPWAAGSNFYVDCIGYVGQNSFRMGQPTFYVGQFLRTNMFLHRLKFLRGSNLFMWVNFYLLEEIILLWTTTASSLDNFFHESLPNKSWPISVWPYLNHAHFLFLVGAMGTFADCQGACRLSIGEEIYLAGELQ